MGSAARCLDEEDEVHPPPSGLRRVASVVVLEPADDLASALLRACDEPTPTSRVLALQLVRRADR